MPVPEWPLPIQELPAAKKSSGTVWQSLPECLAEVLSNLGPREAQTLRLVCKDWRQEISAAWRGQLQPNRLAPTVAAFPHATALSCTSLKQKLRAKEFRNICRLKQLTSLDLFDWGTPSRYSLWELSVLTGLTRLVLKDCTNLRDLHLCAVAKACPQLVEIDLSYCEQLTSKGVAHMSALQNLQTLYLAECSKVQDAGLAQLRWCTRLETLDVSYIPFEGYFLSTLTSLRNLTARYCEELFAFLDYRLVGLTNLTALDIGDNFVAIDDSIGTLRTLPLKQLEMYLCYLDTGSGAMASIATITTLESLCLRDSMFEKDVASKLMALTKLIDLDLSGCGTHVTEADLMGITALKELRGLHLAYCSTALTTGVCERVARLTKLEVLAIDGIKVAAAGLRHLTALTRLSKLSLAEAHLISTSAVANMTTLTALVLASALSWEDRDLNDLAVLPHLEELDVSKDVSLTFSDADCRRIAKLSTLVTLHIGNNPVTNSGFKALLRLPKLQVLHCDTLQGLYDSQYMFYKKRRTGIKMIAPITEDRIATQEPRLFETM